MRKVRHAAVALGVAVVSTVVSGAVAGTAAAAEPGWVPCAWAAAACVDLSTQQAWLMEGGRATYGPVPITSGKPGHATPTGRFEVLWKDRDHLSREFNNAPMPFSVFFTTTGIAFHEGSLQQPSHGCIHLSREAAITFFDRLAVGQEVQVVDGPVH